MTSIHMGGDLPFWFVGSAKKIKKVLDEIFNEDLNVIVDNKSNSVKFVSDDELHIKRKNGDDLWKLEIEQRAEMYLRGKR